MRYFNVMILGLTQSPYEGSVPSSSGTQPMVTGVTKGSKEGHVTIDSLVQKHGQFLSKMSQLQKHQGSCHWVSIHIMKVRIHSEDCICMKAMQILMQSILGQWNDKAPI